MYTPVAIHSYEGWVDGHGRRNSNCVVIRMYSIPGYSNLWGGGKKRAKSRYNIILLNMCILFSSVKWFIIFFLISGHFAGFKWPEPSTFFMRIVKEQLRSAASNCSVVWSELIYFWYCNVCVCMNLLIVRTRKFISYLWQNFGNIWNTTTSVGVMILNSIC